MLFNLPLAGSQSAHPRVGVCKSGAACSRHPPEHRSNATRRPFIHALSDHGRINTSTTHEWHGVSHRATHNPTATSEPEPHVLENKPDAHAPRSSWTFDLKAGRDSDETSPLATATLVAFTALFDGSPESGFSNTVTNIHGSFFGKRATGVPFSMAEILRIGAKTLSCPGMFNRLERSKLFHRIAFLMRARHFSMKRHQLPADLGLGARLIAVSLIPCIVTFAFINGNARMNRNGLVDSLAFARILRSSMQVSLAMNRDPRSVDLSFARDRLANNGFIASDVQEPGNSLSEGFRRHGPFLPATTPLAKAVMAYDGALRPLAEGFAENAPAPTDVQAKSQIRVAINEAKDSSRVAGDDPGVWRIRTSLIP